MLWVAKEGWLQEQYARAKELQTDYMVEEMLQIADDAQNDYMERLDADGNVAGYRTNGEAIQRSKLRLETRQWLMRKLHPKKYGDQVGKTEPPPGAQGDTLADRVRQLAQRGDNALLPVTINGEYTKEVKK
jgi:hypothetical protein